MTIVVWLIVSALLATVVRHDAREILRVPLPRDARYKSLVEPDMSLSREGCYDHW